MISHVSNSHYRENYAHACYTIYLLTCSRMRTIHTFGLNSRLGSKFPDCYRIWQAPDEGYNSWNVTKVRKSDWKSKSISGHNWREKKRKKWTTLDVKRHFPNISYKKKLRRLIIWVNNGSSICTVPSKCGRSWLYTDSRPL